MSLTESYPDRRALFHPGVAPVRAFKTKWLMAHNPNINLATIITAQN